MPSKPLRICQHPGCNTLTNNTCCDVHAKAKAKQYDDRRESSSKRGYDFLWSKVRAKYLSTHPLCERCEANNITTLATLVHHIKRIRDGGDRLRYDNLMSLCVKCHDIIHSEQGHKWGN